MQRIVYSAYAMILLTLFVMAGWTTSIASIVRSGESEETRTESFEDSEIPGVSGVVHVDTFTVLYESVPVYIYFNSSIDFLAAMPINVTLEGGTFRLTSSVGELPFNSKVVGQDWVTTRIVNASHVTIWGLIEITPVALEGNVSLGFAILYSVHSGNQTQSGGWADLYMFSVTIVPSILRPEGWIYANGITIVVGIIIVVRYSMKRLQGSR